VRTEAMPLQHDAYHRFFDASPNLYLVLNRQLGIVTANRAYLASTGRSLDEIAGRPYWDVFPADAETLRRMSASLDRVVRAGEADTIALLRYDIPRPAEEGGGFTTRYWTITHTPVFGADGEVEMIVQHPIDVTDIERMRAAGGEAGERNAALAAEQTGLIDRARRVSETNLDLRADVERLRTLFRKAPGFMAVLRGPEHVFEFVNDAFAGLLGVRDYAGKPVREVLPDLAGQQVYETLDWVRAQGREFVGYDLPVRVHRAQGEDQRYINLIYQPIFENGVVEGIFVEGTDVTEQHRALATVEGQVVQLRRAEYLLAFQLELADCLRPLTSAEDVIAAASRLLGRRLGLARVVFAEIGPAMRLTVRRDWCRDGVDSLAGLDTMFDEFGPGMVEALRLGRDVLVRDVRTDPRTAAHRAAYEAIDMRAHLTIPLVKSGRLRAILSLQETTPREWGGDELRLARDMAERTWSAVETASAQAELRAERDESQYIFDTMVEGFGLVDRDWRIVRMNSTGLQLVERTRDEVIGHDHWEVFADAAGTEVERMCRRAMEEGVAGIVDYQYPLPDGGARWIEVRAFPSLDGGLAIFFRDITQRRNAEDQLRETAGRLRFTLDSARIGDWDFDLATGVSRHSALHDRCFGYAEPVEEWDLDIFLDHVHPDDRIRIEADFRRAVAEASAWRSETRVVWPDGSVHWIAIFGTVYVLHGQASHVAGIVFDISERKQVEEQMRIEAHRKDEFLAMLAHELRNPLAPISAAADLLAMGELEPARIVRTSAIITRQVGHMTSLVDDLLDVSRVTRGLVALEREPVDIKATIADAVEQVRPLVESRRHRLELLLAPEQAVVAGDRKRLVQVLSNLLGNAAKYTPEGGRIALHMEVEPDGDGEQVVLCVIDDGIGMSAEVRRGAFELFTQAERTPDRTQGGLGIGLALVKSLVELHGGTVTAHSDGPGRGSKFVVRLPLAAMPVPHEAPRQAAPVRLPAAGQGRTVLVVDDNEDAAELLAEVLEHVGMAVRVEQSPRAALDFARAAVPPVCILDIGLPDMDGNELARRLRALPGMEHVLLIALTGYGRPQDRAAALAAGFDHHLVKPVDMQKLVRLLG
jgi:PAS domain S-box-containing protein